MRTILLQNLRADAQPARRWMSSLWLAVVVGCVYALSAKMSLALLTPEGVAEFSPAAGVSAGTLIALGRNARWGVTAGTIVATIVANLMGRSKPFELCGFRGMQCRRSPAGGRPDRTLFRLALQSRSAAPRAAISISYARMLFATKP
jgi:hypothetical protein